MFTFTFNLHLLFTFTFDLHLPLQGLSLKYLTSITPLCVYIRFIFLKLYVEMRFTPVNIDSNC